MCKKGREAGIPSPKSFPQIMFFFRVLLSANIQKTHKTRQGSELKSKRIEDNFLLPLKTTG